MTGGGCNTCRKQWSCELARQLRRNGLAMAPGFCQRYAPPWYTNHDYIKTLELEELASYLAKFTGLAPMAWLDYLRRTPTP